MRIKHFTLKMVLDDDDFIVSRPLRSPRDVLFTVRVFWRYVHTKLGERM